MSALPRTASSLRDASAPLPGVGAGAKPKRVRHTPGGAGLGKEVSREAQRLAALILEVLAGARTPSQAAQALGVSLPRYYQLETRALQALVAGCEARPRGPGRGGADQELAVLRRQQERLQRELGRHQALVRLAQRTLGVPPCRPEAPRPSGKGKRRRRAVVRALHAARHLREQSQAQTVAAAVVTATAEGTR